MITFSYIISRADISYRIFFTEKKKNIGPVGLIFVILYNHMVPCLKACLILYGLTELLKFTCVI